MIGALVTRTLVLALGYAYPAYECYKDVERNKPGMERLRFWCQYWILVAGLTIFERIGDIFISWLPMYSEAKLAFFVYLWCPSTRGTTYVYETFFRPYVARHEKEIDQNLLELRTRAGDVAILYWQKLATYGQTRFSETLQFIASQSQPTKSRTNQLRRRQSIPSTPEAPGHQIAVSQQQPPPPTPEAPGHQIAVSQQQPPPPTPEAPGHQIAVAQQQPPPPTPEAPGHQIAVAQQQQPPPTLEALGHQIAVAQQQQPPTQPPTPVNDRAEPSKEKRAAAPVSSSIPGRTNTLDPTAGTPDASNNSEAEVRNVEVTGNSVCEDPSPSSSRETLIEEAIPVSRGRLRKSRSAGQPTTPTR